MKKLILVMVAGAFFASCGDSKKTAEETKDVLTGGDTTYTVNTEASSVKWAGAKKMEGAHHGTVKVSEGTLSFTAGELSAGTFVIDMSTINNLDSQDVKSKTNLLGHLKSADFFHVDTFPTAKFEVTGVEKTEGSAEGTHKVTGNLTIKGQTHGISFPATITSTPTGATAKAKFEINRNEWGIVWGGSKETNKDVLNMLKDNLLKDMITFEVDIVAGN
jgi:polyisoprenoid-binding protein YceI